jgi:hypothetical protein
MKFPKSSEPVGDTIPLPSLVHSLLHQKDALAHIICGGRSNLVLKGEIASVPSQ